MILTIVCIVDTDIKLAFAFVHSLRCIDNKKHPKNVAIGELALWFNKVTASEFKSFNSLNDGELTISSIY